MIVYFSGTGNSRFVAERIAAAVGDEVFDAAPAMRAKKGVHFKKTGTYIFVSPVYAAAPPLVFMKFLSHSRFPEGCRAYFVMSCASGMGASPDYCQKLALEKGLSYCGTAKIDMPQNYIVYFKIGTPAENRAKIAAALPAIDAVAAAVLAGRALPPSGMKSWESRSPPVILKPYYKLMIHAKAFCATEDCVGCGKCVQLCPLGNISLQDKQPVWGERCTHCMACINLCPKEAVEYGKLTKGKPRYHGPFSQAPMKEKH